MFPLAQLGRGAGDDVGDALLRLDPLVEVLVAGEHHVDAVSQEQRLELLAQHFVDPCVSPDE